MSAFPLQRIALFVGIASIALSIATWGMDFSHIVGPCIYCRSERTIIGIMGLLLILPFAGHWVVHFLSRGFAFYGIIVAANQHFRGWSAISEGTFEFVLPVYDNPFLLSAAALFIIAGQSVIFDRLAWQRSQNAVR